MIVVHAGRKIETQRYSQIPKKILWNRVHSRSALSQRIGFLPNLVRSAIPHEWNAGPNEEYRSENVLTGRGEDGDGTVERCRMLWSTPQKTPAAMP
jgi:hypothetical protein